MRYCENESVYVYEAQGEDLAPLLRDAADLVDEYDGVFRVTTDPVVDPDTGLFGYMVTAYIHA